MSYDKMGDVDIIDKESKIMFVKIWYKYKINKYIHIYIYTLTYFFYIKITLLLIQLKYIPRNIINLLFFVMFQ